MSHLYATQTRTSLWPAAPSIILTLRKTSKTHLSCSRAKYMHIATQIQPPAPSHLLISIFSSQKNHRPTSPLHIRFPYTTPPSPSDISLGYIAVGTDASPRPIFPIPMEHFLMHTEFLLERFVHLILKADAHHARQNNLRRRTRRPIRTGHPLRHPLARPRDAPRQLHIDGTVPPRSTTPPSARVAPSSITSRLRLTRTTSTQPQRSSSSPPFPNRMNSVPTSPPPSPNPSGWTV